MSTTIDQRVVEMRFDNKQFESGVSTTISSLNKLNQSLSLDGATKGLDGINAASKKIDLSGLGNAADAVSVKFSALGVMAVAALTKITTSVINTGEQMLKSLTVDPIKDGFKEYELKMGSIQTIMASTGASLEEVNGYLQELNTYSDKTIYSFADMTNNIGKFTNAGVKLEDAVKAIQGISNEAAVSGANANEASRAMYNFAQALSAGYVKLIDWKSIENANMATVEFKQQLIDTALALGTVTDAGDGMYKTLDGNLFNATKNFNEVLQDQWMTSDVLIKTLKNYADESTDIGKKAFSAAQDVKTFTQLMDTLKEAVGSGWATTWEILFGNLEEAKSLWTNVSNVVGGFIDRQADARNEVLQGWKDLGGRQDLIDSFKNIFNGIVDLIKPVKDAFNNFLPEKSVKEKAQQLSNITSKFKEFTEKFREFTSNLKSGNETYENIKNTFKGLFSVLHIVKNALSAVFNAVSPLIENFNALGGGILSVTGSIGEWLVELDETISKTDIFNKAIEKVTGFVKKASDEVRKFINLLKEKFESKDLEKFYDLVGRIKDRLFDVKDSAVGMKDGVIGAIRDIGSALDASVFLKPFQSLMNGMKTIGEGLIDVFVSLVSGLGNVLGSANFNGFLDAINSLIAGGIGVGIYKLVDVLTESLSGVGSGLKKLVSGLDKNLSDLGRIKDSVVGILNSVKGCFEAYQSSLKADVLIKIASAIGILAASIFVISRIDSEKLNSSLGAITVLFTELMGAMAIFTKISGGVKGMIRASLAMIGVATSVLILASALKKIGDLDFGQISAGLFGIAGLATIMVATAKVLGSGGKTVIKGTVQMVIFAAAIKILASACKDLSSLSWGELAKGLTGVGVLMVEVSAFLSIAKFSRKSISTATGIVILAAAMKILASAVKDFGSIDFGQIVKGLFAMGVALVEVMVAVKLMPRNMVGIGVGLAVVSSAMIIMSNALEKLGSMSLGTIVKSLIALGGAMVILAVGLNAMRFTLTGSAALLVASGALLMLAPALKSLGSMSLGAIAKSLIALGGALVILSSGLTAMTFTLFGSAALVASAGALLLLAPALKSLGSMSLGTIAKSLIALGGAMAILAVGLNAMIFTLPGSAALVVAAGALLLLTPALMGLGSVSLGAIAKGLLALAGTFTVLGVAGYMLAPVVPIILGLAGAFALIGVGVMSIGAGLLAAGAGLSALAVGFTALATAVSAGATAIAAAQTVIITGFANLIPYVISKVGEGLIALCKVISDGAPAIGDAIKSVVLSAMDVLVECVPNIAKGMMELFVAVLDSLAEYAPKILEYVSPFISSLLQGIVSNLPDFIKGAVDLLFQFIVSLLQGLAANIPQIVDSVFQLLISVLQGIAANIPELIQATVDVFVSYFSGVVEALKSIDTTVLVNGIAAIGLISALMVSLAGIALLTPAAMLGVVGMGLVISELSIVLAAVGALSQIPGLNWLINEGGQLMQSIGTAIGSFIGGIVGGFMGGVSSQFPKIASDLSAFMTNISGFIEGAKSLDSSVLDGVKALAGAILVLTAADILEGLTSWLTGGSSLADFGDELATFGPKFKEYADSVSGIDSDVVTASANAAAVLADMASNLPKSGGVVGWFAGKNSLSAFADELVDFGPKLKEYADSIAGLDSDVVTNSANAASALSEMASGLPNSGGVAGWFAGENSLSAFAEELAEFGPSLKEYADSVTGLDQDVVTNSTNAVSALSAMASGLPNSGGAVSWFVGDNTLSKFGEELAAFGPYMKSYADSVSGIDPDVVTSSASAATAIADLASILPNSGGVVSWFAGDNTLSKFGEELESFGGYFSEYATKVNGIDTSALSGAVAEIRELMDLAKDMTSIDTSGMSSFGSALTQLGNSSVDGLIKAFSDGSTKARKAVYDMFDALITAANSKKPSLNGTFSNLIRDALNSIKAKQNDFKSAGNALMTNLIDGAKALSTKISYTLVQMVNTSLEELKDKYNEFKTVGSTFVERIIDGIESKKDSCITILVEATSSAVTKVRSKYSDFYDAGMYLVNGFAKGIENNAYKAELKAEAMAKAALDSAEEALGIQSPSKEFARLGKYSDLGFVEGLNKFSYKVSDSSEDLAKTAINSMSKSIAKIDNLIESRADLDPVIRPVLDLSDVEAGARRLNALFSSSQAMAISASMSRSSGEIQNGEKTPTAGTTVNYTQNNYSPKALSRLDIYRQTKNQLSSMKGLVRK